MVDVLVRSGTRGRRPLPAWVGVVPLALLVAGCGGGGGGGGGSDGAGSGADFLQIATTPTNGQETNPFLTDPELEGRLTIRFSDAPREKSFIDPTNAFNGLTANVQILDQTFARVEGDPNVDPLGRTFTFVPAGGTLSAGQYTVTVSRFAQSVGGRTLNAGVADFSSSWTVGPDVYPPVVRNRSPANNQNDVAPFTPIVITFNESLNASTVVLNQTVFVLDGGQNPPVPVAGTLTLERDGFDLVFRPDPCVGYPPASTVVMRILGLGNITAVADRVGNALASGTNLGTPTVPLWEENLQFNTKGVKPLPNPCIVPSPGSLRAGLRGAAIYATTSNRVVALDMFPVVVDTLSTTLRPELTTPVLLGNNGLRNNCTNQIGVFPYGGDFDTRMERTGEGVLDLRIDGATLQTYIYMVDEPNDAVAVINTGTGKIEGRIRGIGSPRGIALHPSTPTLFVSNFGEGAVTAVPLSRLVPGQPICSQVQDLNNNTAQRILVPVGRAPQGIAAEYNGSALVAVANTGDDNISIFNPVTLSTTGNLSFTYQVGESPFDVVWSPPTNVGFFAWVVSQGGAASPQGSVSLWWSGSGSFAVGLFAQNTGSVLKTLDEGIINPGRPHAHQFALSCFIPNSGSDTLSTATIQASGSALFTTLTLNITETRTVGPNPTKMTLDPWYFSRIGYVALGGAGAITAYNTTSPFPIESGWLLPGVRTVFTALDQ